MSFTNWISDDGAALTAFPKVYLYPMPVGADPTRYVRDTDYNELGTALQNVRDWVRGSGTLYGLAEQASAPAPSSNPNGMLWAKNDHRLHYVVAGADKVLAYSDDTPAAYTTVQSGGTSVTARRILNFDGTVLKAVDNGASSRTDVSIATGSISNSLLTNSSVTVTAGSGLSGGGVASLGGSVTLSLPTQSLTPGSYTLPTLTVSGQGVITSISNGSAYTTIDANGIGVTPRSILNFSSRFSVTDNAGFARTDIDIATGSIGNSLLTNSSLSVTAGSGLTGGGSVSLGGSTTLSLATVLAGGGSYTSANLTVDAYGRVTAIASGASTLHAIYAAGAASTDSILNLDSTRSSVLVRDNATPLGTTLFGVQSSTGSTKYLDVSATAVKVFHLTGASGTPTWSAGAASTGLALSITGTDTAGIVQVTAGTSTGTGVVFTVSFAGGNYTNPPIVVFYPRDSNAADLVYTGKAFINSTVSGFSLNLTQGTVATGSTWNYHVLGY